MKDLVAGKGSSPPDENGKYPKARRAYRILGIIHAPLFGAILAKPLFVDGQIAYAAVAFLVGAGLTFGLFYRLAEDHYHGDVPGKRSSKRANREDG